MTIIFYSWQSDLPNNTNRGFIKTALEKAIQDLNQNQIYEPERGELTLDHDTKGEPGSPSIDDAIFKKIQSADIFIADVSLIYQFTKQIEQKFNEKFAPNPNVMLELGYAAHCLSWEQIICICNSSFGVKLPFDLSKRRILFYECDPNEEQKSEKKNALTKDLVSAISLIKEHLTNTKPYKEPEPSTFNKLELFYQETVKSLNIESDRPYKEIYLGPNDNSDLTLPSVELESLVKNNRVRIKGYGGQEFLRIESYYKLKRPKNALIIYDGKAPLSHPYWIFKNNGFIYECTGSHTDRKSPNVFPIEWILMDICSPLLYLKNFFHNTTQIKESTQFKIHFKWWKTHNKILAFGSNSLELIQYIQHDVCEEDFVEADAVVTKNFEAKDIIYNLLEQIFHQFGWEPITAQIRIKLDDWLQKILQENIYPGYG